MNTENSLDKESDIKNDDNAYNWVVGRRKCSIARLYATAGDGKIIINGLQEEDYFHQNKLHLKYFHAPIELSNFNLSNLNFFINVKGGGKSGQAGAIRHAISRIIFKLKQESRSILKTNNFLKRDPRIVERKKYGQKGARKSFQFSKR